MNRRRFIKTTVAGAAFAGAAFSGAQAARAKKRYEFRMITCWPENLPGPGVGAVALARNIERMSGGRIAITVYSAGKLFPAFEVFDAVSNGSAEMGHAGPIYWTKKHEACQFFTSVPFGLNAHEFATWLEFGGGRQLWDELYALFNLKPFAVGNSGVQMGGWFNRQIKSIDDFMGLKIRMPGMGGEVLSRVGAHVVNLPAGEITNALKSGALDAAEWSGPFHDRTMKFYEAAKYYYWPGWHEPGSVIECFVNKKTFDALPGDLQEVIRQAAIVEYHREWSEASANNGATLMELITSRKAHLRRFSDRVLTSLARLSRDVLEETAGRDALTKKIYDSWFDFRKKAIGWTQISEEAFSLSRSLTDSYL